MIIRIDHRTERFCKTCGWVKILLYPFVFDSKTEYQRLSFVFHEFFYSFHQSHQPVDLEGFDFPTGTAGFRTSHGFSAALDTWKQQKFRGPLERLQFRTAIKFDTVEEILHQLVDGLSHDYPIIDSVL